MSDRRTPAQSIPTRRVGHRASRPGLGSLTRAIRGFRGLRSIARGGRTLPLSYPAPAPFRSSATSADHNLPLVDRLAPVIKRARHAAEHVHHTHAGTEHLLLALASLALSPVNANERLLQRLFSGLRVHPLWVIQEVEFHVGQVGQWELRATDDPPRRPQANVSQREQRTTDDLLGNSRFRIPSRLRANVSQWGQHAWEQHIIDERLRNMPLTPRANQAIELARHEARRLDSRSVGPEHLLLGLLREGQGLGADVLHEFDVSLDWARLQVAQGGEPIGLPPVDAGPEQRHGGRGPAFGEA